MAGEPQKTMNDLNDGYLKFIPENMSPEEFEQVIVYMRELGFTIVGAIPSIRGTYCGFVKASDVHRMGPRRAVGGAFETEADS